MNKIIKRRGAAAIAAILAVLLGVAGVAVASATAAKPAAAPGQGVAATFTKTDIVRFVDAPGITLSTTKRVVKVQIAGVNGYPATGMEAVELQLSAFNPSAGSKLVMWSGTTGEPGTASIVSESQIVANTGRSAYATIPVAPDGTVSVGLIGNASSAFLLTGLGFYTPLPAPAPTRQTVFDANTVLTNRLDSGNHGNWATDTIGREAHLNDQGAALSSHCNGLPNCHFYTGTVTDMGTFTTIDGASSPETGAPVTGGVTGQIVGAEQVEFFANTLADSSRVPATMSGNGVATPDWFAQFFPAGAFFSGENEIDWGWTYATACESWTNAKHGDSGDITGADCAPAAASTKAAVTGAPQMHLISVIHQDPAFICPRQPCRFVPADTSGSTR